MSTPWSLSAGWFDFLFVIPIAKGILFINQYVGNVAIGVIGVTIVVNLITLPIMVKSTVSTQKIQLLQPEMEKIQNKYRGRKDQASQMRQNAEIQNLYKKHNVSMFGSFATFLTLPIMIAMWQAVQRIDILYKTSLFGINLGEKPISHIMEFSIEYIVIRNKIKRQVRMIVKETINLDDNYDYIVIVRNKFLDLNFTSNLKEFNYLYEKILKRMEK